MITGSAVAFKHLAISAISKGQIRKAGANDTAPFSKACAKLLTPAHDGPPASGNLREDMVTITGSCEMALQALAGTKSLRKIEHGFHDKAVYPASADRQPAL